MKRTYIDAWVDPLDPRGIPGTKGQCLVAVPVQESNLDLLCVLVDHFGRQLSASSRSEDWRIDFRLSTQCHTLATRFDAFYAANPTATHAGWVAYAKKTGLDKEFRLVLTDANIIGHRERSKQVSRPFTATTVKGVDFNTPKPKKLRHIHRPLKPGYFRPDCEKCQLDKSNQAY